MFLDNGFIKLILKVLNLTLDSPQVITGEFLLGGRSWFTFFLLWLLEHTEEECSYHIYAHESNSCLYLSNRLYFMSSSYILFHHHHMILYHHIIIISSYHIILSSYHILFCVVRLLAISPFKRIWFQYDGFENNTSFFIVYWSFSWRTFTN